MEGPRHLHELLSQLEEQSQETPNDLNLLRKLGRLYLRNGSVAAAVRVFQRLLAQAPDDLAASVDLALSQARLGQIEEARFLLERALEVAPRSATVLVAMSQVCEMAKNTEGQVTFLMRAANAAPQRPEIRLALGEILRRHGDFAGAIRQYEAVLAVHPHLEAARFALAALLIRQNRLNEAMDHLRAIIRLNPSAHDAHYNLGHCLFRQKKWELATASFMAAMKGMKDHPQLHYQLAICQFHLKDWDRAIVHMERYAALLPGSFEAQLALGDLYQQAGEPDLAREVFAGLADAFPQRPESFIRLASICRDLQRFDEAEQALRRLFHHHPGHIEGHRLQADLHFARGQWKAALDEYRNTLLMNENYLPGRRGVAAVFRQTGQTAEEFAALQKVAALAPDDVDVLLRLGELEKILGMPSCLDRFRKITQLAPDSLQAKEASYYLRHLAKAG
ncbi:MAG: TPR repeat [Candidatus Ozemobacter sibiricus]|jgi:tetratricopeptide (TPR) repeat protein|uniref:TPR repeat n=1 Tax=Candidatus Ozemobacter sibiricus TaxID=2268124 RepID=A0A367ZQ53_9BACT|nr:MAG: TPR repeat [Candidatus Ozemobacter sibiricus]